MLARSCLCHSLDVSSSSARSPQCAAALDHSKFSGMWHGDRPHHIVQGVRFRRDEHEMDVIRHEAIGEHRDPVTHRVFAHAIEIGQMVGAREEHPRAPVATLRDVVRKRRENDARNSGHGPRLLGRPHGGGAQISPVVAGTSR